MLHAISIKPLRVTTSKWCPTQNLTLEVRVTFSLCLYVSVYFIFIWFCSNALFPSQSSRPTPYNSLCHFACRSGQGPWLVNVWYLKVRFRVEYHCKHGSRLVKFKVTITNHSPITSFKPARLFDGWLQGTMLHTKSSFNYTVLQQKWSIDL